MPEPTMAVAVVYNEGMHEYDDDATSAALSDARLVEDDAYICKAYAAKFAYEHIEAKFAYDGEEALKILRDTAAASLAGWARSARQAAPKGV